MRPTEMDVPRQTLRGELEARLNEANDRLQRHCLTAIRIRELLYGELEEARGEPGCEVAGSGGGLFESFGQRVSCTEYLVNSLGDILAEVVAGL